MPANADRLMAYPLHQAAVAGDHPDAMIDDLATVLRAARLLLGDRHADGSRETLTERASRRFDSRGMTELRDGPP
jgi:hypothetical protein